MMRKILAYALGIVFLFVLIPAIHAGLNCSFGAGNTCSSATKYLGVENDTGGINNSHAQNYSLNTYANSLCCTTNLTDTLGHDCSDETLVVLSDEDDAHAQNNTVGTYTTDVCISLASANVSCTYVNGSCSAPATCQFSMSSQDNAHLADCGVYDISVCCQTLNGAPTTPTLLLPLQGNDSVEERYTFFNWTDSTDPEGDAITYQIDINASSGCAVDPATKNVSGTSQYTSIDELCFDSPYNWTVRACDTSNACSAWASVWNFTIQGIISISFTSNSTDFGSLQASIPGQTVTNNTLDNDPLPLVIQNTGNVDVNIDMKALSALWTQQGLNTSYFQFADEDTSDWSDVSDAYVNFTENLAWSSSRELELLITVPQFESPGVKSTVLQAIGESAE